jgi:threonine/homoserine/homoserine lactone efflux protein
MAIGAVFAGSPLGDSLAPAAAALLKTAILAVMVVLIHVGWLLAGASLARVLRSPTASRAINVMLALILVATSLLAILPR